MIYCKTFVYCLPLITGDKQKKLDSERFDDRNVSTFMSHEVTNKASARGRR